MKKRLKCKLGFHKYKDIKTQIAKRMMFGFGEGSPGYRVVQECEFCGEQRYIKLNLWMSDKYLYNESIWKG